MEGTMSRKVHSRTNTAS